MNNQSEVKKYEPVKLEHRVIMNLIPSGSSVLDLGCGDGELLYLLTRGQYCRVPDPN